MFVVKSRYPLMFQESVLAHWGSGIAPRGPKWRKPGMPAPSPSALPVLKPRAGAFVPLEFNCGITLYNAMPNCLT